MKIGVTDHAVSRYRERVRPDLTVEQAKADLLRRTYSAAQHVHLDAESAESTELPVDFGARLVLRRRGKSRSWVATTCLVNPNVHVRREALDEDAA